MIPGLLARRRLAWVLIALVTAVLGWRALALRIDPGVESMIPTGRGDLGEPAGSWTGGGGGLWPKPRLGCRWR